jgi:integrase
METQLLSLTPYENFIFGMKSAETKRQYPHRLDKFLTFMSLQGTIPEKCTKLYEIANEDIMVFQSNIIRFINSQRERIEAKEISEGTVCNYVKAIKLFCNMNDIMINWKKIGKGMPSENHNADDRIPTLGEIHKLLEHPDRRLKPIVCVMISSGTRVGSWDLLKWKHVIPIKDQYDDMVIAARINLKNTKINNREYYSFITPEAYYSLKDWMEFRHLHGEEISGDSWLMRDVWQKTNKSHGHRIGLAKYPKRLTSSAIRNLIYEAWKVQGIRDKLSNPQKKRHEFKSTYEVPRKIEIMSVTEKVTPGTPVTPPRAILSLYSDIINAKITAISKILFENSIKNDQHCTNQPANRTQKIP